MSCGNPHEVDCSEVLAAVYRFMDGEMDAGDAHRIREHLHECAPCLDEYGVDQQVKAIVARCCAQERAPEHLRSLVVQRIHQVSIQVQFQVRPRPPGL